MKNIEELLSTSRGARPRRRLSPTFTNDIVAYLKTNPQPSRWQRLKETITMKFFTKPAITVAGIVVAVVATGGATYAAVGGWPAISAFFVGQQPVEGGRIVQVDTQNCEIPNAFTITSEEKPSTYYYKVLEGSKLTNEQIVQIVRGFCLGSQQAKFNQEVVQRHLDANPLNKDRVVGGYIDSTVLAVNSTSISLESVVPYGDELRTITHTFNNLDPNLLVYSSPQVMSLADIKPGDHVSIQYRASGEALTHSETMSFDSINPDEQVVVAIIKNTPDLTASIDYQKYNGKEFEQVVPCDKGYCTIAEYMSNKQ